MGQAYEQKGMYADAVDNYLAPESEPGPKLEYQRLARKAFEEKGMRGYWMSEFHKKFEGCKPLLENANLRASQEQR
jgi:hypothetical protein